MAGGGGIVASVQHGLRTRMLGEVTLCALEFSAGEVGVALVLGGVDGPPPLVRVHSRCVYGEVFSSVDCDCRGQFELASEKIRAEGRGVIIYLEQEGRGSGLVNKARAYHLRERDGLDTVDAYEKLGLQPDVRTYEMAAAMLTFLGIRSARLLTNNPAKLEGLTAEGIEVSRVPLRTTPTEWDREYLMVKKSKLGHDLHLLGEGDS